ncbi:alpha-E domain-containing protein [Cupriavidus necator]|uniref:alpha-E domain-containing protein n=1 Tax=Cupriavidus necator TaxID=106590 RepID=UPI00148F5BE2|nr:alpha-E domain-containing protein [Cupriavidus necator]MDQ0140197.1 putative alpha-E superfamily protein [Cupriavidus necator]NOV26975.1 alpha-E domain-containing protein [Cupriavidus necator]
MLSRTADHLFWMARYTERAENTARMLDVNYQTSLLPQSAEVAEQGWWAMLDISELTDVFDHKYGLLSRDDVIDFMVRDMTNASSIMSCLRAARENARAVRGSLTTEVWETVNTTWLEVQRLIADGVLKEDPARFFEWVKFRSHLARGVQFGTMLKDDAFHFMRLGTFLERADNTARILDVKFQASSGREGGAAEADPDQGSGPNDFYHWAAILRSVSGFEVYRKVYRAVITPQRVAELLILRPDMPRSLVSSMDEVVAILHTVRNQQSAETERQAGKLHADLKYARIDDIFAVGLHAYLTSFLERIGDLGNGISRDFLVPLQVA